MSRLTDFDELYAGSRERLLLQLYAYCGDVDAALDALNEAFIVASHHWHRVANQGSVDGWLRQRAIRRLDARLRSSSPRAPGRPGSQNARFLATLASLDRTSRRLLIIRRLGNLDLTAAAREVGLNAGAAEQALARATSSLHAKGVDTTPAGLLAALSRLGDDLAGRDAVPARSLLRAGARRRYAVGTVVAVAIVVVAVIAGTLAASRPRVAEPGAGPPATTTPPTATATTPVPDPELDASYLLTAAQVARIDVDTRWRVRPSSWPDPRTSVYGDGACVQAADNPPPGSAWIRDVVTGSGPERSQLRQVLQLAPSEVEAIRSYRVIVAGFTLCEGHQLLDYSRIGALGDRAHVIRLLEPGVGGTVVESIVISQSGAAVSVLAATSAPGQPLTLGPAQLVQVAGAAVDEVCSEALGRCAEAPYTITRQDPPTDATADGFLSVVDLPPIPGVVQPWAGTDPERVTDNPSATICDQAQFSEKGAKRVSSRSYVIPLAPRLPTVFGLTETRASFSSNGAAQTFVSEVARHVESCHKRQVTVSVPQATSFASHGTNGWVWQFRQQVSRSTVVTFRVALVRSGNTVAEVTFTPAGPYDIPLPTFIPLAERAAIRLSQ